MESLYIVIIHRHYTSGLIGKNIIGFTITNINIVVVVDIDKRTV